MYGQPRIRLAREALGEPTLVQALQRDLRFLGYLRVGLDGRFGPETERAFRSLQYDLLFNDSRGEDGNAPVALKDVNRGRVAAVNGVVDDRLAACIEELLEAPDVPQLPRSDDPEGANRRVLDALRVLETSELREVK